MEVVQSYYLLLQRVHGTQRWNGTHFPDTDGTDLKMLKITVESRLPTKKKGQIQQNVRQMQRISENCQIFFEEERFDELDFLESIEFFEDNEFWRLHFSATINTISLVVLMQQTVLQFYLFIFGRMCCTFHLWNKFDEWFFYRINFDECFFLGSFYCKIMGFC